MPPQALITGNGDQRRDVEHEDDAAQAGGVGLFGLMGFGWEEGQ